MHTWSQTSEGNTEQGGTVVGLVIAFILEGFLSSNAVDIPGEITDPSFPVALTALVVPNNLLELSFISAAVTGLACGSIFASLPPAV